MVIPSLTDYSFERGDKGYGVFAVQTALNVLGEALAPDGDFGGYTAGAVGRFQTAEGLYFDKVFGPASSERMARVLEEKVPTALPDGLLHGLVDGESDNHIAAVSWLSPGGVDCGYCQRRVYSADFQNKPVVKRAFDSLYQMKLLGTSLRSRHDAYYGRAGAQTHQTAWRLATLHHNYQYAAEKLSRGPWETSYSTSPQDWVTDIGAKFPDGTPVRTPLEWCRYYQDTMTRFVTDWTS